MFYSSTDNYHHILSFKIYANIQMFITQQKAPNNKSIIADANCSC